MTPDTRPDAVLFLDDNRGIYIPRDFAASIDPVYWFGISCSDDEGDDEDYESDLSILSNPDHDSYWDVWDDVLGNAVAFLPPEGTRFDDATLARLEEAHVADRAGKTAERDAILTTLNGQRWFLYQDGALWLVPDGMEWSDKEDWYVWPEVR